MLELQEVATVFSGIPLRDIKDGPARLMRLADLSDVKAGRTPSLAQSECPKVARALPIEEGDLIVAARGSGTDACTANPDIVGAYISLDLYLVRPQPGQIDPDYLRAVLELPSTQAALASEKQGSALARLPKEALEKMAIPVPPLRKQRLIAEMALSFEHERRLLNRLGELKQCLSQEVLSRTVRDIEEGFSRSPA
jgi:hypothetical protein